MNGAAGKAAPHDPKGDDVKVPVEAESDVTADTTTDAAVEPDSVEDMTDEEAEHQRMVEAAIKAGEDAAEEDFKSDASKLRQERDELAKKLAGVADEIEDAKAKAADSNDRLVRLQADWDNYRRRTAQERLDERSRATEKLVEGLLPVIDDLERAIAHASGAAETDEGLRQFSDGVEAVRQKMVGVLTKEGVETIDPAGEPFEPLSHQAVGRVEDKDSYDETVAEVYQKGYRMGGKVIRPAMVTVTYGGPKRPVEEEAPSSDDDAGKDDATEKDASE
jgi:molecular chaperone GrpE